jgi:hypothetical protein
LLLGQRRCPLDRGLTDSVKRRVAFRIAFSACYNTISAGPSSSFTYAVSNVAESVYLVIVRLLADANWNWNSDAIWRQCR